MNDKSCVYALIMLLVFANVSFGQPLMLFTDDGVKTDPRLATSAVVYGDSKWLLEQKNTTNALHKMTGLNQLTLRHFRITENGLEYIASLKQIKALAVGHPGDSVSIDGDLSVLSSMNCLEELDLCVSDMTDQKLSFVKHLKCLRHLFVMKGDGKFQISDELGDHVKSLRRLESIEISDKIQCSDKFFQAIRTLPEFNTVNLESDNVTDHSLEILSNMNSVRVINLKSPRITNSGVASLGKASNLEVLSIRSPLITEEVFPHIVGMTRLVEISLPVKQLGGRDFRILRGLPELEEISIGAATFGDNEFRQLSGHRNIRELFIYNSNLSLESLDVFRSFPRLEAVHFPEGEQYNTLRESVQDIIDTRDRIRLR